jgi:dTDP-4-amino-4,6-dideoxygalactose transaminase
MCSNEQLMQLARSKRLAVVGDATQAHGAAAQGRVAWALGDIEILSFGGSKLITAGRVRLTSDHGHCRSEIQ